jgi:hypothetical protein
MDEPSIQITYDGLDADRHRIDMRLLGYSLEGADRITSDGLLFFLHARLPKRGERAPVVIKVREPIRGSVDYQGIYETAVALLPLGAPIAADLMSGYLDLWWQAIKARFTGKQDIAEVAIEKMAEMQRDHLAARDLSEARAHEREMSLHSLIREAISFQQPAMEKFAAPMGPSVHRGFVRHGSRPPITIDADDAEAIREAGKVEWSKIGELLLRTEGFRFHTNGLSIERPDGEGFLMARVRDPAFEELENPYTHAAQRRSEIAVLGRIGYRDGRAVAVDIVEFLYEIPS